MQKTLLWAVVIVVILGAAYFLWQSNAGSTAPSGTDTTTQTTPSPEPAGAQTGVNVNVGATVSTTPTSATVTYTADGFGPSEVTVKKGGTVTWVNQSSGEMWVATGPHPAHTGYDGTSLGQHCPSTGTAFDECAAGGSFSFTFGKVGTWPYHNHQASSKFGKVIVVE